MSITNGYATLADVKSALRIYDSNDDSTLERVIESASRRIDQHCNRRFFVDTVASARRYAVKTPMFVQLDDIATTTDLLVEIDTTGNGSWKALTEWQDFQLEPLNALSQGQPVNTIRAIQTATFPTSAPSFWPTPFAMTALMRVTAKWGWPSVPATVTEACILMSLRQFKRFDSPLGVAGFGELGAISVRRVDPDIEDMLDNFVWRSVY